MIPTCKTCKWWGRDVAGYCGFVDTVHSANPATLVQIEVHVADDSGLETWLRTGPEFGCIHHDGVAEE